MGPALAIGSLALGAIGTGISAAGAMAQGANAKALGDFQQAQYAQNAEIDVASGQRKMLDQQYRDKLVQGTLTARAAGGGQNPAVGSANLLSQQIAGRGTYNALMDLSQGQNLGVGQTNMGSGDAYGGRLAAAYAPYAAFGSVASGAGSMFKNASSLAPSLGWG